MKTMESTDVDAALKAAAENTTEKAKSYAAAAAAAAATTTAADEEDEEEEDDEDDDEDAAAGDAPETASVRASVRSAYATDFKRDAPPTLTNETRDAFLRDPRLAASYWRIAREHRGAAADDVPQDSARRKAAIQALIDREIGLEASTFVDPAAEGGELFLERVLIAPSDQARVFELGVKLTYATDSPALLAALTEMREAVIADLPIQALLQDKTTAVEAVVGLARGFDGIPIDEKGGVAAGAVRTAALATLRTFAKAIKAAIGHAADGAHRAHPPRYDDEFPAFHVTSRAALSYPPPPGGTRASRRRRGGRRREARREGRRRGRGGEDRRRAEREGGAGGDAADRAPDRAVGDSAHLVAGCRGGRVARAGRISPAARAHQGGSRGGWGKRSRRGRFPPSPRGSPRTPTPWRLRSAEPPHQCPSTARTSCSPRASARRFSPRSRSSRS
jgi:rotatin